MNLHTAYGLAYRIRRKGISISVHDFATLSETQVKRILARGISEVALRDAIESGKAGNFE